MTEDLLPVTRTEMIAELHREVALRKRLYPAWVTEKKLNSRTAQRRIHILEAIIFDLEEQEGRA
jgi:hypothetical protein